MSLEPIAMGVLAIRADQRTNREIAADYQIGDSHVSNIRLRRCWKQI